jgi:hypothetical protein
VREPGVRPVVLIVDQGLGFVYWLGELLAQAGCQALPALNSRDAVRIAADFNLPVVDPRLRGVSKAIKTVRAQYPSLRTIAIGPSGTDAIGGINAQDTLARPSGSARVSRQECPRSVRRIVKKARLAA